MRIVRVLSAAVLILILRSDSVVSARDSSETLSGAARIFSVYDVLNSKQAHFEREGLNPALFANRAIKGLSRALLGLGDPSVDANLVKVEAGTTRDFAGKVFAEQFEVAKERSAGRLSEDDLLERALTEIFVDIRDRHTQFYVADPDFGWRNTNMYSGSKIFHSWADMTVKRIMIPGDEGGVRKTAFHYYVDRARMGGAAYVAGLRRFDRIIDVEGRSVFPGNSTERDLMKSERTPGRVVTITILREGRLMTIVVRARVIEKPFMYEAHFLRFDDGRTMGYLFCENLGMIESGLLSALACFEEKRVEGVIVDLRSVEGGSRKGLSEFLGFFLGQDVLFAVSEGKDGREEWRTTTDRIVYAPVAVLVDGFSFSGLEIAGHSLKNLAGFKTFGDRTAGGFGTGLCSHLLTSKFCLSVATKKVLVPAGDKLVCLEGIGVSPDSLITMTVSDLDTRRDTQLIAAYNYLLDLTVR